MQISLTDDCHTCAFNASVSGPPPTMTILRCGILVLSRSAAAISVGIPCQATRLPTKHIMKSLRSKRTAIRLEFLSFGWKREMFAPLGTTATRSRGRPYIDTSPSRIPLLTAITLAALENICPRIRRAIAGRISPRFLPSARSSSSRLPFTSTTKGTPVRSDTAHEIFGDIRRSYTMSAQSRPRWVACRICLMENRFRTVWSSIPLEPVVPVTILSLWPWRRRLSTNSRR